MKRMTILLALSLVLSGCSFFAGDPQYEDAFSTDSGMHLYYHDLNEQQQSDYRNIYDCLIAYGDRVKINANSVEELGLIADAVIFDNPEIFYMANCMLSQTGDDYYFEPQYLFDQDEVEDYNAQLASMAAIVSARVATMDLYDQLEYLYEYVINNNEYVANAQYNQTVISAMIYQETVCAGYAMMYQYLCDYLGINAGSVVGMSHEFDGRESEYHQWNVVEYDNDYYYVDTTWGDQEDGAAYAYFMFDSDTMTELYTPNIDYPQTSNEANTYFQKNNLYLENYSISQVETIIENASSHQFEIQFSASAFNVAVAKLINSQEIFMALQNTGHLTNNVKYVVDDPTRTISFYY